MQNLIRSDPLYWAPLLSQFASNPYLMHRLLPAFLSTPNIPINTTSINSSSPFTNSSSSVASTSSTLSTSTTTTTLSNTETIDENKIKTISGLIKNEEELNLKEKEKLREENVSSFTGKLGKRKHVLNEESEEIVKKVAKEEV